MASGYDNCWKHISLDDGVYEDGVTYQCFTDPVHGGTILIGYDGSFILFDMGYKASSFRKLDQGNIIGMVYGENIYNWLEENFHNIQGGKKESDIENFHVSMQLGTEGKIFKGVNSTGINVIIEIIPLGTSSRIQK